MNIWHVTTEANTDGRGTRSLGYFTGYIKDIVNLCYPKRAYNLYVELVNVSHIENTNKIYESDIDIYVGYGDGKKTIINQLNSLGIQYKYKEGSSSITILGKESIDETKEYKSIIENYEKLSINEKEKLKNFFNN